MHRIGEGKKKEAIPNFFFPSEIGNFNIGGHVNQLIKKRPKGSFPIMGDMLFDHFVMISQ
jgi:hypothetical protein